MQVRLARPGDGADIQAIYGPIVADTAISFEYEVPDAAEMSRRVADKWPRYPWVVASEADGSDEGGEPGESGESGGGHEPGGAGWARESGGGGEPGGAGILGYAYAGPFSGRAAYAWSTEVSVYVDAAARGRGVARALYGALFALLRLQGYSQAYAGIALPNPASVALHESVGFVPVGCYRNVGWKNGSWHDVGWWQRPLRPSAFADGGPPAPIRTLDALSKAELASALS